MPQVAVEPSGGVSTLITPVTAHGSLSKPDFISFEKCLSSPCFGSNGFDVSVKCHGSDIQDRQSLPSQTRLETNAEPNETRPVIIVSIYRAKEVILFDLSKTRLSLTIPIIGNSHYIMCDCYDFKYSTISF